MNQQLRAVSRLWLLFAAFLFAQSAWAQVSVTSGVLSYTQNFNTLANTGTTNTWTDNTTLPGWLSTQTTYRAGTGSDNAGALYSFGSSAVTERALGSLASGSASPQYGVVFTNNTGVSITSMQVSYTGEQWRNGGNTTAQKLSFSYATGTALTITSSGTSVSALDFTSPVVGATAAALDGNATANRTAISSTITFDTPIADGQQILLRWSDVNDAGNDHGLGIDDLSITATLAGPPPATLSANPTTLTGFVATQGTVSNVQTYTVTGSNLDGNPVSVSATAGIELSTDNTTFTPTLSIPATTSAVSQEVFARLANTAAAGPFSGTITNTANTTLTASVTVSGQVNAPNAPALSASPTTLSGFSTPQGTPSAEQSYTLTAANLTDAISVSAPAGVEVSPTTGSGFISSFTLPMSTTSAVVYVRLNSATATTVNGIITNVSGSVTANVAVSGTVSSTAPAPRIREIQGNGHISPLASTTVGNVPGIVTVLRNNGFWMQDPSPDADDNTSEGIFVFTSSASGRTVGESVTVSGTVQESRANVQNLSITQITSPTVTVVSAGNALPAPVVISSQAGAGVRLIPTNTISNDFPASGDVELSVFDPAEDGLDFFETLEGMRVQINNPVTTSLRNNFGEVFVIADKGAGATGLNSRGTLTISGANTTDINSAITNSDFNPERIQIDDVLYGPGGTPNENVGTLLNTIVGVVSYDFQNFEILPSVAPTVSASNVPLVKETTNLLPTTNQLTVASFNVENLAGNEPQAKYDGLAQGIRNSLGAPDILALEEIQDNNGATNDATVDATTTLTRLRDAIVAAGGPTYDFRQINPVDDQDGGQPGGNIRVGLFFNPARVQFIDRAGGGSTVNTTVSNNGGQPLISASPGRILDTNPGESDSYPGDDFTATRKPLVGEFTFNGQPLFVIVNHFSSRGGSGALSQRFQPPVQEEQGRREEQGKIVNAFVDQLLAVNPNTNVVVAGDFNEFQFLPAMQYLKGNVNGETPVLTNLIESLPPQERFTYTFDGNAQALDYILGSNAMNSKLDAYDAVHLNAEFIDQLSDHDPSVARFNFAPVATPLALTVTASPTILTTSGTTTLSATVSGGTTPYSYSFSGPGTISQSPASNTASVSNLPAGVQTFTVVASDATSPTAQTISGTVSVTVTETNTNTPPTVANPVPPQSATVGIAYTLSLANVFTDAETPNDLTLSVSSLPAGLSFTAPSTISGTPSMSGVTSVTVTATDPGSLTASTSFTITVNPAAGTPPPTGTFSITGVTTLSCEIISAGQRRVTYNPRYAGLDGTPVSFSVVNEMLPTTAPGPYTLDLFTDNPVITLSATQSGANTLFAYNWLSACSSSTGNTPPTVANPVPPQSATVGIAYTLSLANVFTDAETPNGLVLSVTGLPAGLNFVGPSTISGTPSMSGVSTVTVTATDPGSLSASTSFTLTVNPAGGTPPPPSVTFSITSVQTISCEVVSAGLRRLTFNPQYAGTNGAPISFSVVNELAPTTNPGPYTLNLYTDNPVVTLQAVQSGISSSFAYNWLAVCSSTTANTPPTVANPVSPQSATVGVGYTLSLANVFTDAETPNQLTLSVSGLPAGLSFTAPSTISGTPSMSGVSTVTVTATDPGSMSASTSFTLTVNPAGGTPPPTGAFSITGVTTVSCEVISAGQRQVSFTPRYAGLDGSPVSFSVVNEMLPTTAPGPYTLNLYTDNPTITLSAVQSGVSSTFAYNWLAACTPNAPSARVSAEPVAGLHLQVLGNPTREVVSILVTGAAGGSLNLTLTDGQGRVVGHRALEQATASERVDFQVNHLPSGVLILRANTPTQSQLVKVIKAD